MEEPPKKEMGVAYNLSLLQVGEIFKLLSLSNKHFLAGDFPQMIHTLRCCKLSVIQNLSPEEREQLRKLEEGMDLAIKKDKFMKEWNLQDKNHAPIALKNKYEEYKKLDANLFQHAEDYKIALMDILEKHNYLVKRMEDYKTMWD